MGALTNEFCWLTIAAIRSDKIEELPGGMSKLLQLLLSTDFVAALSVQQLKHQGLVIVEKLYFKILQY